MQTATKGSRRGLLGKLFTKKRVVSALSGALASGIFLISHNINENHIIIQNKFEILSERLSELAASAIYLNVDCLQNDEAALAADRTKLKENLTNTLNAHRDLGGLVSVKTYCSVHLITNYSDKLLTTPNICHAPLLKNEQEVNGMHDFAHKNIQEDKLSRRGAVSSLEEYFSSISSIRYSPKDCENVGKQME